MAIPFGGDQIRRDMAAYEFNSAGLSSKAADALVAIGVLSLKELLRDPWSDADAGRRFTSLPWRLSVSPHGSERLAHHIEATRSRLLAEQAASQ